MRAQKQQYRIPRNYVEVGAYLRNLRLKAGLTQRQVSLALGYSSAQFISNHECGVALPPKKKLTKLRELYRLDSDYFIKLTVVAERIVLERELKKKLREIKQRTT